MRDFTNYKRLLAVAEDANVPVTLKHEELSLFLDALEEQEGELINLKRQLEEAVQARRDMRVRAVIAENSLADARKRIAELESALGAILLDMDKAKAEERQYMPLVVMPTRMIQHL